MTGATRQNIFRLKRSNVSGKIPTTSQLLVGEMAVNTQDGFLFTSISDSGGTITTGIRQIGWDRISRSGDTMSGPLYGTVFTANTINSNNYFSGGTSFNNLFLNKFDDQRLFLDTASTGLISFSGLSFTTSSTTFNVSPIKGWFIDSAINSITPSKLYVEFPAQTGITLLNLTGQNVTYIAVNSGGTIIQQSEPFLGAQHRDLIRLGAVVHSNRIFVNAVNDQPNTNLNTHSQLVDFMDSLGSFNVSGNTISPSASTLTIIKYPGIIFKEGSNFVRDIKSPHRLSLDGLFAPNNMRYRLRDGTEYPNTAFIDPNNYDNNGVLTPVPDTKYAIHRVFLFQSNLIRIQYGQQVYDTLDDARAGIVSDTFFVEQNLRENGTMVCAIIVRQGCTDLSNINQAKFVQISRFGIPLETNTGTGLYRRQILTNSSTGLISGGTMSISSITGGTITINAGTGVILDNFTVPSQPRFTEVFWNRTTGYTLTNLNTQPGTAIYVTSGGTFIQRDIRTLPNPEDSRNYIFLGAIGHPNSGATITFNLPTVTVNPVSQLNDFTASIGPFSISGNKISKLTGTLSLFKSAGRSFMANGNFNTNPLNPSIITVAQLSGSSLSYVKQDRFLGFSGSSIDTGLYDNGGTLTLIPNNDFVAHRIWHNPSSNLLFFQYGQATYSSLNTARASFGSENFIIPSPLEYGAYLVAIILVRQGETNLDDTTRSEIIPQNKFSGTGGGSSPVAGLDTYVTGFTYNNANRLVVSQNMSQSDLTLTINVMTGLTITGLLGVNTLTVTGNTMTTLGIDPITDNLYSLGSTGKTWSNIHSRELRLYDTNGSDSISIKSPSNLNSSPDPAWNLVLPLLSGSSFSLLGTYDGSLNTSNTTWFSLSAGTNITLTQIGNASGGTLSLSALDTYITGFTNTNGVLTITDNGGRPSLTANTFTTREISFNSNDMALNTATRVTLTPLVMSVTRFNGSGAVDDAGLSFIVPNDYVGNPQFYFTWRASATATTSAKTSIDIYTGSTNELGSLATSVETLSFIDVPNNANTFLYSPTANSNINLSGGNSIHLRIFRDPGDATDTFTGDLDMINFVFKYRSIS